MSVTQNTALHPSFWRDLVILTLQRRNPKRTRSLARGDRFAKYDRGPGYGDVKEDDEGSIAGTPAACNVCSLLLNEPKAFADLRVRVRMVLFLTNRSHDSPR